MINEQDVMVQAVRTFDGDEGFKNPQSEPFTVSRQRAADLKANGLVEEVAGGKAAPEHENKMAGKADNKAGQKPGNK